MNDWLTHRLIDVTEPASPLPFDSLLSAFFGDKWRNSVSDEDQKVDDLIFTASGNINKVTKTSMHYSEDNRIISAKGILPITGWGFWPYTQRK